MGRIDVWVRTIVEIGAVKYMMSRQVCKQTNTLISEEHSNSGDVRYAMRTKTRIDSRGHVVSIRLKTTVLTQPTILISKRNRRKRIQNAHIRYRKLLLIQTSNEYY